MLLGRENCSNFILFKIRKRLTIFSCCFLKFSYYNPKMVFHTPVASSVILARRILLKLGGYGFIRFGLYFLMTPNISPLYCKFEFF